MKRIAVKTTCVASVVKNVRLIVFLGWVSLVAIAGAISLQAAAQTRDINLEMMLESILKSAPTGIGLVEDRVILQVNDYILELTGYSREELIGQNARIFYPTQEDFDYVGREKYRQIAERGTGSVETRWQRKDGEIRYVLLSSTPLDPNDLSAGVTFTVLDITDRKHAEATLITRTRWFMAGMGVFSLVLMALVARLAMILREKRYAMHALRASEAKHRRLFETMTQGIIYQEADGLIISANPAAENILGITLDQMQGKTSMDPRWKMILEDGTTVPGEEHPSMIALRTGKTIGPVTRGIFHPDKDAYIWLSITAIPLFRPGEDAPFQAYASFDDITERIQAEHALRASEEKLAALFSSMTEIVVLHELVFDEQDEPINYRILDCNKAFTESTGILREAAVGRLATEVYKTPEPPFFQEYSRVAITGVPCQFTTYFAPMKKHFAISAVSPRRHQFATIAVDITEQKHAEERLQEFKTAVEQSRDGIAIADMEGHIRFVNEAWAMMHGYSTEELLGQHLSVFHSPEQMASDVLPFLQQLREAGDCMGEVGHIRRNGETFVAWMTTTVLKMADQQPFGIFALMRDITEQKQAEEEREKLQAQLRQSQKMESVGRLAGGVAHDFNNMLSAILGHTELAMDRVTPDDPIHADLEEIYKAAQRSADLTRQLLAFARKQTIAPKVLDLNETIEDALKMLRRLIGEDVQLAWEAGAGLWPVKMDPSQVDQILANLCVNARDAIHDVGKITIETANVFFEEEHYHEETDITPGEYVLLAVSDNGCGMDQETLSFLFEPFFTTKAFGEGTGLGLATVYGAVRQNNGFINVYSEPGQGTTFKIYLPRHTASTTPIHQPVDSPAAIHGSETILLVEDDPAILKMARIILEKQGYAVLAAETPSEAIRLAREHDSQIHLLMTDVVMPEMNGSDLARHLVSLFPEIKCLFMSGYTANVIAHHGVLDEGVHFIQKPFRSKDVAAKVRAILDGPPSRAGDALDVQ